MMEHQINQANQEDYLWAMRLKSKDSESEFRKRSRSMTFNDYYDSSWPIRGVSSTSFRTDEYRTRLMATFVPDEIIYNINDYSLKEYDGCVLFGDISGFTDLCEKYNETGQGGASRLTEVLNAYIGSMVQEIMSYNGDVWKFSGDAFLAIWKCSQNDSILYAIHEALDCALIIQKSYGFYETDVGVLIRVKLALSAGHIYCRTIGDENHSHYLALGQPIKDIKITGNFCNAGDILIHLNAWQYLNPNEYLSQPVDDGYHIRILGLGPNWRSTGKVLRIQNIDDENRDKMIDSDSDLLKNEEISLRPAINAAITLNLKTDIKKFILPSVLKSIEMNEPFEYLTEMRQITVVFINIITNEITSQELLQVSNTIYQLVCSVAIEKKGTVNKAAFFDKDLMVLVIFGLRGYKHELESQSALKCASECYTNISALKHVKSVSIGVTTGKTYCGVVGHSLRREYTVISLTVNKAARLMVAYENKVTCDRETFLHSKMEARNFILQEPKELKGIYHPGPIYLFREITTIDKNLGRSINPFPILGRDEEINLFQHMTKDWLIEKSCKRDCEHKNMLLIYGDTRQGKTRLLEELIFSSPSNVPVNRIFLRLKDYKIPYQTIRSIFSVPLGLMSGASVNYKEVKIQTHLQHIQVPELFCVLNDVFGVNFKTSPLYESLKESTKRNVQKKMIQHLSHATFITNWMISIDDAECMDEDSWELLLRVLKNHMVFIFATLGKHRTISEDVEKLIKNTKKIKIIELTAIDKLYHCGLACQILDVYAIPAELEKVIQGRSKGNPGWIENFLISLLQSRGISIRLVNHMDINNFGLLTPPFYMMIRMSPDEIEQWQKIVEEKVSSTKDNMNDLWKIYVESCRLISLDNSVLHYKLRQVEEIEQWQKIVEEKVSSTKDNMNDLWKIYVESCRESLTNLTMRKQMDKLFRFDDTVPVCIITSNFNISDVESELSMDVFMLKIFDSLTSYEQLLVKCSAVLGDAFPRNMLVYIMSSSLTRLVALAVKRLFEIRVLKCGKSHCVHDEDRFLYSREKFLRNYKEEIKCECTGLEFEPDNFDLPKYASCNYLQFRSSLFREIAYNLLTDNQKKEFHNRAIRYLEKETRRCRACGSGFFSKILGIRYDDGLKKRMEKHKKTPNSLGFDTIQISSDRLSTISMGSFPITNKNRDMSINTNDFQYQTTSSNEKLYINFFGLITINRLKNSYSLTRPFALADFTDCECMLILSTIYSQLLEHCRGANDFDKILNVILEYSYTCIKLYNLTQATKMLRFGLEYIETKNLNDVDWKMAITRGKIYTLMGNCLIRLGQNDQAYEYLMKAMHQYGFHMPSNKFSLSLRACSLRFDQLFGLYIFPHTLTKQLNPTTTELYNYMSECLSLLCDFYMRKKMWEKAKYTALLSFSKAIECSNDFNTLCKAFGNLIIIAMHYRWNNFLIALEVHALRLCYLKKFCIEADELKIIAELYFIIFSSRLLRSDIEKCNYIGYIVLRISNNVNAFKITLSLLPLLNQVLLIAKRAINAASLLNELDYIAHNNDTDNSGKLWFYALCICFQLETGYTITPYTECEKYYLRQGVNLLTIRDPDAKKRFLTVMWLWCIRNEFWDAATVWCTRSEDFTIIQSNDNINNQITALYLLEGLIISLVRKMDKRNFKNVLNTEIEIKKLIKIIKENSKYSKVILPRLYHLKAYFKVVRYNDLKAGLTILKFAKNLSLKFNNLLEYAWIEHTEKAWTRNMSQLVYEFWRTHSNEDNMLDYRELDVNTGKLGLFSLPIPIYL